MNRLTLAAAISLSELATIIVSCVSCNKHGSEHDGMNHNATEKNINYPAAYIVNGAGKTISVIDLSSETVKETIELNGATFPHHIYLNPDKTKMAVAITGTDLSGGHGGHSGSSAGYKIQIINTVTAVIEKELLLSKMPHNAIFSPDGKELWLAQPDSPASKIAVYNTSNWQQIASIESGAGTSEITLSADGKWFCAANTQEGTAAMFYPDTKQMQCIVATGQLPVGVWPGTAKYSYVDNEGSKTISEFDLDGDLVSATINLGFKPGYVAFYQHTNELWVSDATHGKVVYYTKQAGTWAKAGEITTGTDAHAIAFTTDGSKAFVTNQGAGTVSVINPTTHQVTKTIVVGSKPNGIIIKQ